MIAGFGLHMEEYKTEKFSKVILENNYLFVDDSRGKYLVAVIHNFCGAQKSKMGNLNIVSGIYA